MKKALKYSLALFMGAASLSVQADNKSDDLDDKIDAIFANIPEDGPGCSVGVIKHGELVHQDGYGLANLELNNSLDGSHVHRIASVSKQFTAMAVLLLADEGKISLSADIRQYLPKLRNYGSEVTINAMLGHVAGMGDYDFVDNLEDPDAMKLRSSAGNKFRLGNEDYLTISEFYDYVKTVPLRHEPEKKWQYSNYAYFLLSMLVEKVSGESLRDYAERRIFKPLNMTHTFFSDQPTEIVKRRASGYRPSEQGGYINSMTNLFWVGDGGLHTNVEDMAKWDRYFYNPTLGNNPTALLRQFLTPNSEIRHERFEYANGQMVVDSEFGKIYTHSGGWLGTVTNYERIPDKAYSSIVFCNSEHLDARDYASMIRKVVLNN
ncbi:serine hydrolase domain-containing protein [Pseudoalteromonas sp. MMG005]|uniref:serine hydrolase domain-containing protein n=1 Tax=Pseudoalteromonas sp. MMG005 TaxID=2822682 RepID=UPI001B3A63B1|nr:serine hydrolase domain-containing protein [Pseudoalteromonas sp. MMG005]MBQ4845316.1 beta-lactamase family protein [Pseudoalteromonas sp. MMG005]